VAISKERRRRNAVARAWRMLNPDDRGRRQASWWCGDIGRAAYRRYLSGLHAKNRVRFGLPASMPEAVRQ